MLWRLLRQTRRNLALRGMQKGTAVVSQEALHQPRPLLVARTEPGIEWRDYDRITPGVYSAYCRWAKHYQDRGFKRWTCLLRFDVLSDDLMRVLACVPMWMNLGSRDRPHAGRRGTYFAQWVRANDGPPARQDRLSPRVFTGRVGRVEIGDTNGDAPYSVVRKILSWETGSGPGHSVNKSHSQGRHREAGVKTDDYEE